jgi:hypothetical protein
MRILDDGDPQARMDLISLRLQEWKTIANS